MKKLFLLLMFSIFLIGIVSAAWTADLNVDLTSGYKLDEVAGTNVSDVIGGKNLITQNMEDADWVAGLINNGLRFEGTNEFANRTGHPSINAFYNYSISFWWKNSSASNGQIMGNGIVSGNGIGVGIYGGHFIYESYNGSLDMEIRSTQISGTNFHHIVLIHYSNNTVLMYLDNVLQGTTLYGGTSPTGHSVAQFTLGKVSTSYSIGTMDELYIWENKTITATDVNNLYNAGAGISYQAGLEIFLLSPDDEESFTTNSINFSLNVSDPLLRGIQNVSLLINGVINQTNNSGLVGFYNWTNIVIPDGDWNWSVEVYDSSDTIYESAIRDFSIFSFEFLSAVYNNKTWETATETFFGQFRVKEGTEISLAQLDYNGTNYTITNLSQSGTEINLTKTIDIPLNLNPLLNETKTFKFRFIYNGLNIFEEELEQNVSFINFQRCNATYNVQALNFTFFNEINQTIINGSVNPTNFESSWKYWIGTGTIYKSYSFQNLTSALNNYTFCIYPYVPSNYTFKTNSDIDFSAVNFRENEHHLRNSTLTNVSSDILMYLLHTDYATKFFLTFKQGTSLISQATITVQKYFTGLGTFKTVSILTTDDNGEGTMWQEVDKNYKYSVVKDGILLGTVERVSICSVTPCSLTILIPIDFPDPYEGYYGYYAQNIVSNLNFNKTSKMVTYNFIDTTGLANYFRLVVRQSKLNQTGEIICDSTSYSTAGTLTCNLTGYSGEFVATGYISRSPEKVDKIINFLTDDEAIDSLGLMGIFLVMGIIITLVFAGAVVGRGSPSVVLGFLGAGILGLKLGGLFPFTWIVVTILEVLILFIMSKVKA